MDWYELLKEQGPIAITGVAAVFAMRSIALALLKYLFSKPDGVVQQVVTNSREVYEELVEQIGNRDTVCAKHVAVLSAVKDTATSTNIASRRLIETALVFLESYETIENGKRKRLQEMLKAALKEMESSQ